MLGGAESVKLNAEIGHSRTSAYEVSKHAGIKCWVMKYLYDCVLALSVV